MTDDETHAAMAADKGEDWKWCDDLQTGWGNAGDRLAAAYREAMHDRDGLQASRDAWREEAERLQAEIEELRAGWLDELRDLEGRWGE